MSQPEYPGHQSQPQPQPQAASPWPTPVSPHAPVPGYGHPKPVTRRKPVWVTAGLGLLAGVVIAALIVGIGMFSGVVRVGAANTKIEGPGFATPEAAVRAYLEALGQGDAQAMIATYAVESYAEKCSFTSRIHRYRMYQPMEEGCTFPDGGNHTIPTRVIARQKDVVDMVYKGIRGAATPMLYNDLRPTEFNSDAEISTFEQRVLTDYRSFTSSGVTDVTRLDPRSKIENYSKEADEVLKVQSAFLGVNPDDISPQLFSFRSQGRTLWFGPDTIRYNDRWYILSGTGLSGLMARIPVHMQVKTIEG